MVRMFIRHPVEDYDRWRRAYDDFESKRRDGGVVGAQVLRNVDDGNDVTVSHDFDDADRARAFAFDEELKEAMGAAGVSGPPDIWFVEEA